MVCDLITCDQCGELRDRDCFLSMECGHQMCIDCVNDILQNFGGQLYLCLGNNCIGKFSIQELQTLLDS